MLSLDELKKKARDIVNRIDWTMTPEKAIDMYLEWGSGWTRGKDFVRDGSEDSFYFVIYDWERPFVATLLRRNSKEVEELAKVVIPEDLALKTFDEFGKAHGVGVYALTHDLKAWLSEAIDGPPVPEDA